MLYSELLKYCSDKCREVDWLNSQLTNTTFEIVHAGGSLAVVFDNEVNQSKIVAGWYSISDRNISAEIDSWARELLIEPSPMSSIIDELLDSNKSLWRELAKR